MTECVRESVIWRLPNSEFRDKTIFDSGSNEAE